MRLRLPLNGLKLCQCHPIFHIALAIASYMVVDTSSENASMKDFY